MKVGFIASTSGIVPRLEPREALRHCGNNTGNLLFHSALYRVIDATSVERFDWDDDPNTIRDSCDVLVIPEANAVNPFRDYAHRARFLRSADLPCVVIGLGAQARQLGDEVSMRDGTKDFLREIGDRSFRIGVRGEYTAEILEGLGIRNTVVSGCPSNLLNLNDPIELMLGRSDSPQVSRLQVSGGDMKRTLRQVERQLFRWCHEGSGRYIPQSGVPAVLALGGSVAKRELRKLFRHFGIPPWRRAEFMRHFSADAEIFLDAESWVAASKPFDLTIGTRLHGAIASIQAGVPAVLIRHDSRTAELSRTQAMPAIDLVEAEEMRSPEELLSASKPDWAAYIKRRAQLGLTIADLLGEQGIPITPDFRRAIRV